MKTFRNCLSIAVLATGFNLIQLGAPADAATFDFLTVANGNYTIKSFLDSGITLDVLGSNSTGNNPGTINVPGNPPLTGLCAWAYVDGGGGRCGYGTSTGSGISTFQLKFDKAVNISSLNVSAFDGLSSGSIGFSLDNSIFNTININSVGDNSLASVFSASANQTIYVQSSGAISGSEGGVIRLGSLTATEQTPAPLPIFGAAAGFRISRQIRNRIRLAARQV